VRFDATLNEIVLFELPEERLAEDLSSRLATKRMVWLQSGESASVIGVLLNPDLLDLAGLLRDAQAWLQRSGVALIRFEVDGRSYVLEAEKATVANCAAS